MPTNLEQYDDLQAKRDLLTSAMETQIMALIPEAIRAEIAAIREEMQPKLDHIDSRLDELKELVKADALFAGTSLRSKAFIATYCKAGKTVKVDDLLSLATRWERTHPVVAAEMKSIIQFTKPTVRVQARRDAEA